MKALNQNGYEQVEEDVVSKGHEGYKVEGSQRRGGGHPVIEHRIPVLLGEDLQMGGDAEREVKRLRVGGQYAVKHNKGAETQPTLLIAAVSRIIRVDSAFNISLSVEQ